MGKTYQIRKIFFENYESNSSYYFNIVLSKGTSSEFIEQFYLILDESKAEKEEKKFLHIELPFSPELETLDFIWGFTMWNLFENKREKSSNLIFNLNQEDLGYYFLAFEIPSNRKENSENGLNDFSPLKYFQETECQVNGDEFLFKKYNINSKIDIEQIEDQNLKNVAKLIELSNENFQNFYKIKPSNRIIEISEKEPDKNEFFNLISNKISEKVPNGQFTFKLFFNIWSILKNKYYDTSIYKFSENETLYQGFISQVFSLYVDSMIEISRNSFHQHLTSTIGDTIVNEMEDFSNLLKDKIPWNERTLCFPIFSVLDRNEKNFKFILISNKDSNFHIEDFDSISFENDISIQANISNEEELQISIKDFFGILELIVERKLKETESLIKDYPKFLTSNNMMKMIYIQFKLLAKLPISI
eukprot:Anaeramoba_ignava/a96197_9.p1 GENE.a96197_9~~a96197_9.p1  ORF type:complete len:417 (+),score=140.77 a96197_9:3-1253(+)